MHANVKGQFYKFLGSATRMTTIQNMEIIACMGGALDTPSQSATNAFVDGNHVSDCALIKDI